MEVVGVVVELELADIFLISIRPSSLWVVPRGSRSLGQIKSDSSNLLLFVYLCLWRFYLGVQLLLQPLIIGALLLRYEQCCKVKASL